jgi:tetratricopeptide (TPR) repeat protein
MGFDPVAEASHITDICCLVEGMPLAIELAATWVRVIPCAEIGREIRVDLDMLSRSGGALNGKTPGRHDSLNAVFEHSWRLLDQAEQRAYMQLSVFRGGFDREAAHTVAGASLSLLRSLVDKSLLRLTTPGRYDIHTLLRQAANARLAAHPHLTESARGLHAAYYAKLLFRWKDAFMGDETRAAIAAVGPEIDNIRAAWRWAVEHEDLKALAWGVAPLSRYYLLQGPFAEGASVFGQAARRAEEWGLQSSRSDAVRLQAFLSRLLIEEARFLNEQGRYEEAARVAGQAMDAARVHGSPALEAIAGRLRGEAFWYLGDYAGARPLFEGALQLVQQTLTQGVEAKAVASPSPLDLIYGKLPHIEAALLKSMAQQEWATGGYAQAHAYAEQALVRFREVGDRRGEGLTLNMLGAITSAQGDMPGAMDCFEASLDLRRTVGDRQGEGLTLVNLGAIALRLGDCDRAYAFNRDALQICNEIGDRRSEAVAVHNLGLWAMKVGAYEIARGWLEEGLHARRRISERRGEIGSLQALTLLSHYLGDDEAAQAYGRQAVQIAQEIGEPHSEAFSLIALGHACLSAGALDEAEDAYRRSLEMRRSLDQLYLTLEPLAGLARIAFQAGRRDEAAALAAQVWDELAGQWPEAALDPLWIYLICYQVLAAAGDPRAEAVIRAGHQALQERAVTIGDEALRRSFFENVAVNREIVRLVAGGAYMPPPTTF